MDPLKDFIHIDDLFKELHNGEEQERSGSWLHMKELLDKELPLGVPVSGGRSFRRYIIPLLALLLLGGGGAYYGVNHSGSGRLASENAAGLPNNNGKDATASLSASGSVKDIPEINGRASVASDSKGAVPAASPSAIGAEKNITGASVTADPASGNHHKGNNHTAHTTGHTSALSGQHSVAAGPAAGTSSGKTVVPVKGIADKEHASSVARVIEEEQVIEEIKSKPAAAHTNYIAHAGPSENNPAAAQYQGRSNNLQRLAMSLNDKKIVKDQAGTLYKEERDTFKRVDLVEKMVAGTNSNGRPGWKTITDTVAVSRMEKVRYIPLNPIELAAFRKLYVAADNRKAIPLANVRDRVMANEMVSLVPLTHYKVASRKVDPGKFNQLIQNTSMGISSYFDGSRNFYAAVLVGGNTSFGNPGAFGMQLGIAGLYSLGERLTLAAEFKYVNHYFSNYTLNDQSVTFENVTGQQTGNQWLFAGTQTTSSSVYKVNGFGALEVPVTLSYNLGRVSLFAGLDMAYAFPISWQKETTLSSIAVQQAQKINQNPFLNEGFRLDEKKDFSSRIGLGYVWGISYDFSRKISLDARISQILLDNNKGNTDALNRLFRIPTLQMSLGYYFGRKDKVVYIMDKR